jgi:hypothetical protein
VNDHAPYDAKLPILAELEGQIDRAAQARLAGAGLRTAPPDLLPRGRSLRVSRRVAVLAALICLVGATATATVTIWRSSPLPTAERTLVAQGERPAPFRLELHELNRRLCATLLLGETVDSDCLRPPGEREVTARVVDTAFTQFVYGLAGSATRSIEVLAGPKRARTPSRPLPAAVREALPRARNLRYFVVAMRRGGDGRIFTVRVPGGAGCSFATRVGVGCRSR